MNELNKLLSDVYNPDEETRLNAVRGLSKYEPYEYTEHVVKLLSDYNNEIRKSAALTLGKKGNDRAVPNLVKALSDKNEETRKAAVIALGRIGDYKAIVPLRSFSILEHNQEVKNAALTALKEIDKALIPIIDSVKEKFKSSDPNKHRWAINRLSSIGTQEAVSLLIQNLAKVDAELQISILESLDKLTSIGIEPFVGGLKNDNWKTRIVCIEFLSRIKDPGAIEPLVDLIEVENNIDVKKTVAEAFGEIGCEDALYYLRNMLSRTEPELNKIAISSISKIGGLQAIEYLIVILREEEGNSLECAEKELIKLGYKALPELTADFASQNNNVKTIIKKIVKEIGEDAMDYFLQLLKNNNPQQRKLAVEFLEEFNSKCVLDALLDVAKDDSATLVRQAASKAIKKVRKNLSGGSSFIASESILHRVSSIFSEQVEKLRRSTKSSLIFSLKSDKLKCSKCGGIISRKASTVELDRGQVEFMRFGSCPICEKVFCKLCADEVVIRGLTALKCPNCAVELSHA